MPFSGRTLHVVDYENVFGGLKPERVRDSRACYERAFVGIEDDVVVAAHPRHFPVLPVNWQNARHRFRDGKNGADLALLEVLDDDHVLDRFETVVIASGDGIFVKPARRLRRAGIHVHVVSKPPSFAKELRQCATSASLFKGGKFFELAVQLDRAQPHVVYDAGIWLAREKRLDGDVQSAFVANPVVHQMPEMPNRQRLPGFYCSNRCGA